MKKTILMLIVILGIVLTSCEKKEEKVFKTYTLIFKAHFQSDKKDSAHFRWLIKDADNKVKYNVNGDIHKELVIDTTTVNTNDWIYIYMSINDTADTGTISCRTTDNTVSVYMFESTNNGLYINKGVKVK